MVTRVWLRDAGWMVGVVRRRVACVTPALAAMSHGRTTAPASEGGPRTLQRSLAACLALVACWGLVPRGYAAVMRTDSCALADVQSAVNTAAPGDTVQLPPCIQDGWHGTVTINKRIILEGSGTANTVIQRSQVSAEYGTNPMFRVNDVTGFEMRNLTLDGTYDTNPNKWRDTGLWLSSCVDFRIHHMAFKNLAIGVQVQGDPLVQRGLIDHNTFTDNYWKVSPRALGYGVSLVGKGTWPPLTLGTAQNVFIEDNTFTRNRHAVASNNGSRYVFRYNTIIDNREDAAAIDVHGYTGTWPRGSRQYEVYHNRITNSVTRVAGVAPRGGDGVIFNNVMSPMSQGRDIWLLNDSGCSGPHPRKDQIRELYIWGNTRHDGSLASVVSKCPAYKQENRDYFLTARPNYTPYTYPHPAQGPAITRNLAMHLTFDEGTGSTAQDATGNNHVGTLGAGATWGTAKLGASAVQLDGTTQGIVTVPGLLGAPAAVTLAAWIKPATFPTPNADILTIGDYVILRVSATYVRGSYYDGSGWTPALFPVVLDTTAWHHVAYTVEPGVQRLYLNGVQVAASDNSAAIRYADRGSHTMLGGHGFGAETFRFQGTIDEAQVYPRALSSTEVAALAAY